MSPSQSRCGWAPNAYSSTRGGQDTAILTNGTIDPQRHKLQENGLVELVNVALVSEEVGHHKPSPEAFRHALGKLDLNATEAAMIGDDLAADIEGALHLGFSRVVWVNRVSGACHPDDRVIVVRLLDQVMPAVGHHRAAGDQLPQSRR